MDSNYVEKVVGIQLDAGDANKELKSLSSILTNMEANFAELNKTGAKTLDKIDDSSKKSEKSLGGISKGINKISSTIKASAIGLFLIALTQLQNIFSSSQPVVDAYNTSINFLKVSFNSLSSAIKGAGSENKSFSESAKNYAKNFISNQITGVSNLVSSFKELVKGNFSKAFDSIAEASKNATDSILGTTGATQKLIDEAKRVTELEKEYAKYGLTQERLSVTYETQAEQLRQIRDNVDLDINDRIEANNKLSEVLEKQGASEKAVILEKIANLREQESLLGVTEERTNEIFGLNTALLAVENKITGQRSEQKTNATALAKELRDINRIEQEGALKREQSIKSVKVELTNDELEKYRLELLNLIEDLSRLRLEQKKLIEDAQRGFDENGISVPGINTTEFKTRLEESKTAFNETTNAIELLRNKYGITEKTQGERELQLIKDNVRAGFETRLAAVNQLQELAEGANRNLFESEVAKNEYLQQLSNERIAIEQAEADFKNGIQNQYLDSVSTGFRLLRGEFEKSKDVQAGLIIAESSVGIARTVINTVAGNQRAVAELGAIASIPFVAANTTAGVVGVAENVLSTRKALQALKRGGGTSSTSFGASAAPNFNIVESSGNNQLAATIGAQQNQPVQAFVVGNAVTSQQALDRNIIQNATFL